jgi:hypothetical protein
MQAGIAVGDDRACRAARARWQCRSAFGVEVVGLFRQTLCA